MQSGKKSLKSKISLGLIILMPLGILLYLATMILKTFGMISQELLWKYVWPNILWPIAAFSGLIAFFILAWMLGSIYYSKKAGLSRLIDNCMSSIPAVKLFWHVERFKKETHLDFSKVRAAIIKINAGIWQLVFLMGQQEFKENRALTAIFMPHQINDQDSPKLARVIYPTVPLPFTGFFYLIDEEELRAERRIIYLKTPAPQLFQIYLSFGFLGPEKLEIEE